MFRFLWRQNANFAISRHYKRYDVFVEAEANKAAGKYDNSTINEQIDFYIKEGLQPYSEAKFPITSGRSFIHLRSYVSLCIHMAVYVFLLRFACSSIIFRFI